MTSSSGPSPLTVGLLAALLCLALLCLLSIGILFGIRRYRRAKKAALLPSYNDEMLAAGGVSGHRRARSSVTVNFQGNSKTTFTVSEKTDFINSTSSPPPSPLPEIHITFPEEVDEVTGKTQSGRVVVVRLNDHGNVGGVEPADEDLPAYQQQSSTRFQSLDLERIGGLREKA